MRKLLFIVALFVLAGIVYGEEATVIPKQHLRLTMNNYFGVHDDGGFVSRGYGAEYGVANWLNLQLMWNQFVKLYPDFGSSSLFLGAKAYIFGGEGAFASAFRILEDGDLLPVGQKLRLSGAFGILIPPADSKPDLRDQDQQLWGSSLRLYGDFVVKDYFYINAYFEGVFYPPQYQNDNIAEYRDWVRHYQDFTFELEAHFEFPVKDVIIKFGAPVRYFCAPYMNASDEFATSQYFLSLGTYFGVKFDEREPPVEMYLKYNTFLIGQNIKHAHWFSFVGRVTLPPIKRAD